MLAATRARDVAPSDARVERSPASRRRPRGRLVAPLAAQGARALGLEPLPSPRDGRRGGLACALRGELAARGPDLLAAVAADRHRDAGRLEGAPRTRSMTGIGLAVQGVWATGFIGIRLTWARSPRRRSARASASASVSFTPPIIVTS